MKLISVPKNKKAMLLLDFNNRPKEMLDEIEFTDTDFNNLWCTGIFIALNNACDVILGDFEDEFIIGSSNLNKSIGLIQAHCNNQNDAKILEKFELLFIKAIEYKTGVFFYF